MSTYKSVTHVIFDIDGLLLDTESLYKIIYLDAVIQFGATSIPDETKVKLIGMPGRNAASTLIEDLNLPVSLDEFLQTIGKLKQEAFKNVALMPGAERLVMHLYNNKVPMACATSSSIESLKMKMKNYEKLFKCFHHITAGPNEPDVKRNKPAPDVFLVCASKFPDRPSPKDVLVFEDSPIGVKGAKAAGMQVIMVPEINTENALQRDATMVISSLNDFRPELFSLPPFPAD